jgi:hypothetical protein
MYLCKSFKYIHVIKFESTMIKIKINMRHRSKINLCILIFLWDEMRQQIIILLRDIIQDNFMYFCDFMC